MERITLEQAKQYISLDDDFTNKTVQDCPHFTLTPSPKGDGWETVTYYTARKTDMYANRGGDYDSWVYILSNPTQPNLYKIGYTKNTPANPPVIRVNKSVPTAVMCKNGFANLIFITFIFGSRLIQHREYTTRGTVLQALSRFLLLLLKKSGRIHDYYSND